METGYIKFEDIETNKPVVEVKIVNGTVWMAINEIADLFGTYTPTINKHLNAIFKEGLLREQHLIHGQWLSIVCFGLLASEWSFTENCAS